jgi:CheY-like chemotaxis protein
MTRNLPGGTERILFVDDEEVLTGLARESLAGLGYQVTICTSSVEALRLFRSAPADFDLLITDLLMADGNGDDLAEEVLAIRPDLPTILVTGIGEDEGAAKAAASGITMVLAKPHSIKDLAETIRAALER